jgi:NAD(P)-dependent dehydrogenase (short-subunit alcohol dehydrogenase family)
MKSSAGRIVNMSSGLSLALYSDPKVGPNLPLLAVYASSKTALDSLTIQFAHELRGTPTKVNSADPGQVSTDLSGHRGDRTVEQEAAVAVRLALLPADGPTGGFFDEHGPALW